MSRSNHFGTTDYTYDFNEVVAIIAAVVNYLLILVTIGLGWGIAPFTHWWYASFFLAPCTLGFYSFFVRPKSFYSVASFVSSVLGLLFSGSILLYA